MEGASTLQLFEMISDGAFHFYHHTLFNKTILLYSLTNLSMCEIVAEYNSKYF